MVEVLQLVKKVYENDYEGQRRGRPRREWHDMVRNCVGKRSGNG